MSPRLHVLLGAGGVGKTTLATGYALALAGSGRRVGLLGIDPSRRLQDALGIALADEEAPVPGVAGLRAAIVHPHQALGRWVAEACRDPEDRARLQRNPFFAALGDRLATATDVFAAVRVAEWAERDPGLDDLVVDTAPGLAAVDFLRAPRQVEALVKGALVRWLRAAARVGDRPLLGLRAGARRVIGTFARVAGTGLVLDLADFFALVRAPLEGMLARVERAQRWLRSDEADLLLVTSPRDTGASGARQLVEALRGEGLAPRAVVINRMLPEGLGDELAAAHLPAAAARLAGYARSLVTAQSETLAAAATLAPLVVALPSVPALDRRRRATLAALGEALGRALELPAEPPLRAAARRSG